MGGVELSKKINVKKTPSMNTTILCNYIIQSHEKRKHK